MLSFDRSNRYKADRAEVKPPIYGREKTKNKAPTDKPGFDHFCEISFMNYFSSAEKKKNKMQS